MNVEQRCVLPSDFGIAVHEFESRIDSFLDSLLKINRWRDCRNDGKDVGILVCDAERALSAHADAQERYARRHGIPMLCYIRNYMFKHVRFGRDSLIEFWP